MHADCHPVIMAYARCNKLRCNGGAQRPYHHDRIFMVLPSWFNPGDLPPAEYQAKLAELHDAFLAKYPEGGQHKWHIAREYEPSKVISVKLPEHFVSQLAVFHERSGQNRSRVILGLLIALLDTDKVHGLAAFRCWQDEYHKHIVAG